MGIRPKLFLLFFALGILPVLLLSIVNFWYGVRSVESVLRAEVEHDAAALAEAVEAEEREQESRLIALARTRSLRDYMRGGRDARTPAATNGEKRLSPPSPESSVSSSAAMALPEDVRAAVGTFLLNNQGYYRALTCLDTARRPLFHVELESRPGERILDLDALRFQTGELLPTAAPPDERVWATPLQPQQPLRSPIVRESSGVIMRYTVPVFTGEEEATAQRGALVVDLKLDGLLKESVGSLAALPQSSSTTRTRQSATRPSRLILMLDRAGRILYHTNEELAYQPIISAAPGFKRVADAMMAGESGWKLYDSAEGDRWLAAYRQIAPLDLSVAVAGDYTAAAASLHRAGWISLLLSALVGLGVAFLLSKVAGRATRSIERVTEGAVAIARGDLNQRIEVRSSDEIHLLAESFNSMTDRLREQIAHEAETRQFEAFMRLSAMLTHDLKNAISSLSLLVSNMERQFHNEEFRTDAMLSLKDATAKLRGLVARLSEPVASLSGEFQRPRATDLVPIIKRVLATTAGSDNKLHEVETHLPPTLVAKVDAARLEKVIENLVLNALEAMGTKPGRLTVEAGPEDESNIFFSIGDTGPGMTEDFQRTRLFRPFATTKSKGIGLGLYTCREVVRAYGGHIDVRSEKDTGTTFRVVLPSSQITEFRATRR